MTNALWRILYRYKVVRGRLTGYSSFVIRPASFVIAAVAPQVGNQLRQGLAFDKLHSVKMDAAIHADLVDRHDMRVVQLGRCLGLKLEALQLFRVESRSERQDLQSHAPIQRYLLGFVDNAHAAAAD